MYTHYEPERPLVRTLTATLCEPSAHKERKLDATRDTYRKALHAAFESPATSRSAVNDIVIEYDLTTYAKDALKQHVPQLKAKGGTELGDNQPVRFTNRAAWFDHDAARAHPVCWRVPQAGRGNAFWVPLAINPDQRDSWRALIDETSDVRAGELKLQFSQDGWRLRVAYKRPVPDCSLPTDPTPIGVDLGESVLLTACTLRRGRPVDPLLIDGGDARKHHKAIHTIRKRLQQRDADEATIRTRTARHRHALTDSIEQTSRHLVDYAVERTDPVLVLEDLTGINDHRSYGAYMNRRLHNWARARLRERITAKASEAGVPVVFVPPAYTSQTCHACDCIGRRSERATFTCSNEACHISEFHADINAAANVAARLDPWGESLPLKAAGDDSPGDGRTQ